MTAQLFTNNAASVLASSITNVATSLTVTTGHGARFPTPTGTNFFLATLCQQGSAGEINFEIVKVTARSTDTFTIVRAQEGTTALAYNAGDKVELRLTKGTMEVIQAGYIVKVNLQPGVDPTGVADSLAGIQACINANQSRTLDFGDSSNTYKCTGTILLVDSAGHNFQGNLIASGATINFTHTGSSSDTDAAMARGFQVLPLSAANGNEVTGMRNAEIRGLTITCPTNGAGFYLANSQRCSFVKNTFNGGRYSIAMECCINTVLERNTFSEYKNAGVGLIMSSDTSRVCYNNAASPGNSYWNDSPQILSNAFSSSVTGGLAHILDMGSQSERIRNIQGNYFYNAASTSNQYGYLARNSQPKLDCNWFENINYPIRILNTNLAEGGGNLAGVSGAQPSGTYPLSAFVDGYSYTGSFQNNYTLRAINDYDLSGITGGPCFIASNYYQETTGFFLKSTQSGSQKILDGGNVGIFGSGGAYKSLTYNLYYLLGSLLNSGPTGIGYATGAGALVTQLTSKSTAVTINTPCGRIAMHAAALAAGVAVYFQVNCSVVAATDAIILTGYWGAVYPGNYRIELASKEVGFFEVRVTNITAGSLSEALKIDFAILKAVAA